MKIVLAVALTLALSAAGALVLLRSNASSRELSSAAAANDAAALAHLEARLGGIEERLEQLARRTTDLEKPGNRAELASRDAAAETKLPNAEVEVAGTQEVADRTAKPASGKLEKWLEAQGMREEMETLVARVYETSRSARKQKEQDEAEARQREIQALSEGPYGKYNFRVNSLGKKLDLSTPQKNAIANLYARYDDRRKELVSQYAQGDGVKLSPEAAQQRMQERGAVWKDLSLQLDNEVLLQLTREQQDAYKEIPSQERGTGDRGVEAFAVAGGGAGFVAKIRDLGDHLGAPVVIDAEPAKPQPKPAPQE